MNATEFIATALEGGRMWIEAMLGDIDGVDAVAPPTPNGGNHALWVLGHLAVAESAIFNGYIRGAAPTLTEWEPLFGMGSRPVSDVSKYPGKAELLAKFQAARAETLAYLRSITDADLDRPSHAAEHKEMFGTVGRCFAVLVNHQMFHAGQVADVRRALGKKPVFG